MHATNGTYLRKPRFNQWQNITENMKKYLFGNEIRDVCCLALFRQHSLPRDHLFGFVNEREGPG